MAIQDRNLVSTNTEAAKLRIAASVIQPVEFAASGADVTYPVGMLVAFNTSTNKWAPWVNGGSNGTGTVSGIIWSKPVDAKSAGEVIGNVMKAGRAHFADLVAAGAETPAQIAAALRVASVREKGLIIEGLDQAQ